MIRFLQHWTAESIKMGSEFSLTGLLQRMTGWWVVLQTKSFYREQQIFVFWVVFDAQWEIFTNLLEFFAVFVTTSEIHGHKLILVQNKTLRVLRCALKTNDGHILTMAPVVEQAVQLSESLWLGSLFLHTAWWSVLEQDTEPRILICGWVWKCLFLMSRLALNECLWC